MSVEEEKQLIDMTLERATRTDDPVFETIKMQVTFESFYATELQRLRSEQLKKDQVSVGQADVDAERGPH